VAYNPEIVISRAPHIKIKVETTRQIMGEVILALLPATIFGVYLFGSSAAMVVLVGIIAAVLTEALLQGRVGGPLEVFGDGSAALTGLLLALTLPPTISPGYVAVGAVAAILFGKVLQGGLGRNLFNPALVGRAVMLVIWPAAMTTWVSPVDGASAATALGSGEFGPGELFLGTVPGSIGETSALLLLAGAVFLLYRGRVEWRIPLSFMGATVFTALLFQVDPVVHLLGGGLMIGALYMATDWVTSPMTRSGKVVFGIGCGVLTVLIRELGQFPEGITYSILLMNAVVPLLDRYLKRKALGEA
jgi:Na+-translocating ferredoxin:NAD+ oxidoreductase subunit D